MQIEYAHNLLQTSMTICYKGQPRYKPYQNGFWCIPQ
ncbi:hypothetical protein J2736_005900 [Paenibacillus qinlingensis]|uniref:Uncharacterized protein n=1 Tax=Paenibacillus qinlingensis TaxID=1837343 RepID=A0ABU1P4K4_9BACL|nr:hypothetical protein [Paenibacillus qinlingensis]